MGLTLKNPIIVSSSGLTSNISSIKKCANVNAGAIVLKSLFEEQFIANSESLMDQDNKYFWFPESIEYINKHSKEFGLNQTLQLIKELKDYTDTPIIASINCVSSHEWPQFAKTLEEAGADGIELNISIFPFDKYTSSKEIEDQYITILKEVKRYVSIPVSVKLSDYFTNLVQIVNRLDENNADALVLFNRFYRPDIDIEKYTLVRDNFLSSPEEATKALRWVAMLSPKLKCQLVGATGIHDYKGVVKHLLAGASAVQLCSVLYKNGLSYIEIILDDLSRWIEKHKYESIDDFRGKICNDQNYNADLERLQFLNLSIRQK